MVRNQSIDLIKIVAMLGVISLHCCLGRLDNPVSFVMSRLSGISIPLFFTVSGYLLVGKDGSYKYVFKKILGILRFVFIITFLYWFIFSVFKGFDLKRFADVFLGSFIQKGPFGMFWYFGAMCLIYFLLPVLSYLNKHISFFYPKLFAVLVCVDFVIFILTIQSHFEYNLIQSLRLYNWLTYFSIGAIIKEFFNYSNNSFNLNINIIAFNFLLLVFCGFVFVGFVYYCKPYIGGVEYFFTTPLCMLYTFTVFYIFEKKEIKYNKYIDILSELFLPVYTLHYFVIMCSRKFIPLISLGSFSSLVEWLVISFITLSISYFLMRISIMRRIFSI